MSKMRKKRKQDKHIKEQRRKKEMRERMRLQNVVKGLSDDLSVTDIHRRTGLSQKNIRKIMLSNSNEITFLLLKRQL